MRLRKRKRKEQDGIKAAKRCLAFFTTICIVPVIFIVIIMMDSYSRPQDKSFIQPQFDGEIQLASVSNNITMVAKRMQERRNHLRRACNYLGLDIPGNDSLHKPNPWEFLVDYKHHLVWCNVFKAASTSWMYNFNILAGYTPKFLKKSKVVPLSLARQKYPRPSLEALRKAFNDSVSFLIARHPLERLLSAYKDKIEHSLPNTLHRKLGNEIILKYRKRLNKQTRLPFLSRKWPIFPEFVEYVLDCVKQGIALDMHWTPITTFCTPCMFDFDVIAHTETLQDDQQYLIVKAQIEGLVEPQYRNVGHGTTARQIKKYYTQLTRSQILQLYHIYRYDFELFNYTLTGYLEWGKPDEDPSALLAAITFKDFLQHENNPAQKVY